MKANLPFDSSQMYFWTKKWQKMEQEAKKDIETGAILGPHNSVKILLKHLNPR